MGRGYIILYRVRFCPETDTLEIVNIQHSTIFTYCIERVVCTHIVPNIKRPTLLLLFRGGAYEKKNYTRLHETGILKLESVSKLNSVARMLYDNIPTQNVFVKNSCVAFIMLFCCWCCWCCCCCLKNYIFAYLHREISFHCSLSLFIFIVIICYHIFPNHYFSKKPKYHNKKKRKCLKYVNINK